MKHIINTGLLAITLVTISSCSKSDDHTAADTATLTMTSPMPLQEYHTGDTVHIMGAATNVVALHGYHTCILNAAGDTLFEADEHAHAVQLDIHQKWIDTLSAAEDLKVIVSATVDHDGNELKKEIPIKALP